MATQEYLIRHIEACKKYEDLPNRLQLVITGDEWRKRVKSHCMHNGYSWGESAAGTVCAENDYYESLLQFYRTSKRVFPYHLAGYICRILRGTPFNYYREILADAMRDDLPYDAIPNFTAADALRVVGVGRNEYIVIMIEAKSKKLLWRMNKAGVVRDLLPTEPQVPAPDPWWTVHVVNLTEAEFRGLAQGEMVVCEAAAREEGIRFDRVVDQAFVLSLYRRGLLWFDVPVGPEDRLSMSTLEGFVSNRTSAPGAQDNDPLEELMYQVFVAASDTVTVIQLAGILGANARPLGVAISVACRLKFCRKVVKDDTAEQATSGEFNGELARAMGTGSFPQEGDQKHAFSGNTLTGGVAIVVDAEITGFLMMGALTPGVKKHSVTLFEGGRLYGAHVIDDLIKELRSSRSMATEANLEGEMAAIADIAGSLAALLECIRLGAGQRPIEVLRKESLESLSPTAASRILVHSYSIIIPTSGLTASPLPLSPLRPGPTNYGPLPITTTPWMQLALYEAAKRAPQSLVLPQGARLTHLPKLLRGFPFALLWPWSMHALRMKKSSEPLQVPASALLVAINRLLSKSAAIVQPLHLGADEDLEERMVYVPLPLPPNALSSASDEDTSEGWTTFEEIERSPKSISGGLTVSVRGYRRDGAGREVPLTGNLVRAIHLLGLSNAVGVMRLLWDNSAEEWVALAVTLGIPLIPVELCDAVCSAAQAVHFLNSEACSRHDRAQRSLFAAVADVAGRHGVPGPSAGGADADVSVDVALPVHPMTVESDGRIVVASHVALNHAIQGSQLVSIQT